MKDNAIYHLAAALTRVGAFDFPAQFTDGSRAYFTGMAKIQAAKGETEVANAMNAFLRDPADEHALALVSSKDPSWNATLRTTCIATMLDAGHATNALPQRARANVNCRIFPGVSVETVRAKLEQLVADPAVEPVFVGRDLGNIHGLNEYVGVKSLLEGREFLYRLVKIYAEQK